MHPKLERIVTEIQQTPVEIRSNLTGKLLAKIASMEISCEIVATDDGLFFLGMNGEFIRIKSQDICIGDMLRPFDIDEHKRLLISELNFLTGSDWVSSWWSLNEIAPKEAYTSLLQREQTFGPFTVLKRYIPNGRGFYNTFSLSLGKLGMRVVANSAAQIDCELWTLPLDYAAQADRQIAQYAITLMA